MSTIIDTTGETDIEFGNRATIEQVSDLREFLEEQGYRAYIKVGEVFHLFACQLDPHGRSAGPLPNGKLIKQVLDFPGVNRINDPAKYD